MKNKRRSILIGILVGALVVMSVVSYLWQYDDYSERSYIERGDTAETTYIGYQGNLLKYSRDGAFYLKYNGDLIWNYTYEMPNPQVDVCGNYILIYDENGTQVSILTNTGYLNSITTSYPIVEAEIAGQGTIAILTQNGDTGYVTLYDTDGNVVVSGELHMQNNGYPITIEISEDATRLAVSQVDMTDGDVKTTITFYDFSKTGQDQVDNQIAIYSFADQIFPRLKYLTNGKLVAYGDTEVVVFGSDNSCSIEKEIYPDGELKNVFYNDSYFGYLCNATDEEGNLYTQMAIYTKNGICICKREVSSTYTKAELLDNNQIYLTNGEDVAIYTRLGVNRFAYTFESGIYGIIPTDGWHRYYVILNDRISYIGLR